MFYLFIHSLLWTYFLQETIKYCFNDYNIKIMALINYTLWWIMSLYGEYNRLVYDSLEEYEIIVPLCLYSTVIFYLYELYYYTPDLAHSIHHVLTILIQIYMVYVNFFSDIIHLLLGVSAYWSMITSSFSALRYLSKYYKSNYISLIANTYRISYVTFKSFSIISYYIIFTRRIDFIRYNDFFYILVIYTLIHINQMYFMGIIIRNYFNRKIK